MSPGAPGRPTAVLLGDVVSPLAAPVEVVERKGVGHPDTLCDTLADAVSIALCRAYLERSGRILHHNVDKALLWAGRSAPAFGGGEIVEPIEMFVAGRAAPLPGAGPDVVAALVDDTVRAALTGALPELDVDRHLRVHSLVRPGAGELVELFERARPASVALANDTSCGVGFAPLSPLERAVLAAEAAVAAVSLGPVRGPLGPDIKVMGVRRGGEVALTVACAMVGRHLGDLDAYLAAVDHARSLAATAAGGVLGAVPEVVVNAADDLAAGSVYLTVVGSSVESGDDGQTGRGNRGNGLITPGRPMTMESVAGKNPVSHVGKLYNLAASDLAERLVAELADVTDARCLLVSRIGAPVDEPQLVEIGLACGDGRPPAELEGEVRELVAAALSGLGRMWERLVGVA